MNLPDLWPVIGIDESGKGDFFGPLVVAGMLIDRSDMESLARLGVRDSKTLTDRKVADLAATLRQKYPYDLVVIGPEKYNQLYNKIRNLNRLLGWGHARVLENILKKHPATAAISDQFGHERFIRDSLQAEGRKVELIQMVRGEAHPAVAAASILARAEFVRRLEELSGEYGCTFPRGAGSPVDEAARSLVAARGLEFLNRVAKCHFRNYKKIDQQAIS